jgi:hypothetical protein
MIKLEMFLRFICVFYPDTPSRTMKAFVVVLLLVLVVVIDARYYERYDFDEQDISYDG